MSALTYYFLTALWFGFWVIVLGLIAWWVVDWLVERTFRDRPFQLHQSGFAFWRNVVERLSVASFMVGMGLFQLSFSPVQPHAASNLYRTAGAITLAVIFGGFVVAERIVRPRLWARAEEERENIALEAIRRDRLLRKEGE